MKWRVENDLVGGHDFVPSTGRGWSLASFDQPGQERLRIDDGQRLRIIRRSFLLELRAGDRSLEAGNSAWDLSE
jgi:hypothetical protein